MRARRSVLDSVQIADGFHAGLWLDRFLPEQTEATGAAGNDTARLAKGQHIRALEGRALPAGYRKAFERWRSTVGGWPKGTIIAEATAEGRMVVGLGAKGALETGLTLEHTWGVPVLPGSALKGLAASTGHLLVKDPAWSKNAGSSSAAALFGTTDETGAVRFHDAWMIPPVDGKLPIAVDVMTSHHTDYYGGQDVAPSDMDAPNPIAFATIHGRFLIVLEPLTPECGAWAESAYKLLEVGLQELGIGAKTAAGYGRMSLKRTT